MFTAAIVEDHPVFREALRQLLGRTRDRLRISEFSSFTELQDHLRDQPHTDIVLLDLEIPGARGFSALSYIHFHYPHVRIAVVSGHEEADVIERAFSLGAEAFVPKSIPLSCMLDALESFLQGNEWRPKVMVEDSARSGQGEDDTVALARKVAKLTPQQRRVVMGMAQGRLNKQIAYELGITEGTVKNHVTSILRQLDLRRRTEVINAVNQLMQIRNNPLNNTSAGMAATAAARDSMAEPSFSSTF